jgi:two-component system, OmpR family, response regulator CpxR
MNQEPAQTHRVLIVDDDEKLCDLVAQYMSTRGFEVECEGDGAQAVPRIEAGEYSLVVLDVMLPGLDGFEVLRRLRAGTGEAARVPVVMLTAHGDEVDRIVGLELGADDYVPKPFNARELLARVQAILRRVHLEKQDSNAASGAESASTRSPSSRLQVGDVEMDIKARRVSCKGQDIELTAMEFDLLAALLGAAGEVVTREDLAQNVLRRKLLAFDRSLDMHISKLRRKLGPANNGTDRIKTVRAIGYIYTVSQ